MFDPVADFEKPSSAKRHKDITGVYDNVQEALAAAQPGTSATHQPEETLRIENSPKSVIYLPQNQFTQQAELKIF